MLKTKSSHFIGHSKGHFRYRKYLTKVQDKLLCVKNLKYISSVYCVAVMGINISFKNLICLYFNVSKIKQVTVYILEFRFYYFLHQPSVTFNVLNNCFFVFAYFQHFPKSFAFLQIFHRFNGLSFIGSKWNAWPHRNTLNKHW